VEQANYLQGQEFEIARRNSANYAVADFSTFQGGIAFVNECPTAESARSVFADYDSPEVSFKALTENRPPIVASAARAKFRQRTFPGKPLSDDAVVHANRIASEIEDDSIMR
jgi:hypothetical protein